MIVLILFSVPDVLFARNTNRPNIQHSQRSTSPLEFHSAKTRAQPLAPRFGDVVRTQGIHHEPPLCSALFLESHEAKPAQTHI